MPGYNNYKTISVKGHYRTYRKGSYPGPYKDVRKWIKRHPRKIKQVELITQSSSIKRKYPYYNTMIKEIPPNLIESIKTLVKDQDHEYSIDIDFERQLETPEQMLVMKGGKKSTTKIGDFELFGHSHPNQKEPEPSNTDLKILTPFKPEFIVAGKTGKTIIMNIEDYDKWNEFKESNKKVNLGWTSTQYGRDRIFEFTGVRIYPMVKNLKIELKNDPHPEKRFPRVSSKFLQDWQTQE